MALIATGIAAISIGLSAVPASADQVRQHEYWLKTLHITSAWTGSKGSGVTVAVLSDGVGPGQVDLAGSVTRAPAPPGAPIASGRYFGEQGTAIASLIAGHGHGPGRNLGIIGAAPEARILAVPVTLPADDPQVGQASVAAAIPAAIAAGIRYAVKHGARVIDLPIDPGQPGTTGSGGSAAAAGGSAAEKSAVAYALRHDVVLVAPAGDDGASTDAINYPAAYPGVIAVGAFNKAFDKAAWSNHQSYVTVTAAGAGVIAASGSGYQTIRSTNAASAIVSGVAALIRARYPQLTVAQVRKALTTSTLYRRPGGLANGSGYGAVDAAKALTAAGLLTTTAAHRSGAGALPRVLPSGSLASSGSQSVGAQIAQAGEVSAAVLALLLLLIAGYVAMGRRRRSTEPVVSAEWMHRQALSRYPTGAAAEDPMLEFFSAPMARPGNRPGQAVSAQRSDPGLFAPAAGRRAAADTSRPQPAPAPGGPLRPAGGLTGGAGTTNRGGHAGGAGAARFAPAPGTGGLPAAGRPVVGPTGPGSSQPAVAADDGSWQSHGPASRAISRRPSVTSNPPWAPASPPASDLPWTTPPGGHPPAARPVEQPAASAEQPWLAAPDGPQLPRSPRPGVPSQPARPGWTPTRERPVQRQPPPSAGLADPAAFGGQAPLRTAGSGLPVRQPGANVPRPLSPSGSLWEPVESRRADQVNDDQDPGSRPIYVWNPDHGDGDGDGE
jgi:hypothetical protein